MRYAFLLCFLSACFSEPIRCETVALPASAFSGDVGDETQAWNPTQDGVLTTSRPGPTVQFSLDRSTRIERIDVRADGYDSPPTFVGVSALIVGRDPETGDEVSFGDVMTTGGAYPPMSQTLSLAVDPGVYDWPEALLRVVATGSPGERRFKSATLYPSCP